MNELKKEKRWVLWALESVGGRQTKVPYTIRGKRASSTNPEDWSTYKEAKAALHNFGSGIGVVFTPDQSLLGIDIDHVLTNKKLSGEESDRIKTLLATANTYTEISPSGSGLHIYFRLSSALKLTANRHAPFEAYTDGRFFTFTEKSFQKAKPIRTITSQEAEALLTTIGYPWSKSSTPQQSATTLAPVPKHVFTDADLLAKMFRSKNGDAILALYDGDASAYKKDFSRADAALLNHLAFWSQKDSAQMERIWLASPLGKRAKTQKRADYRLRSIQAAIASCKTVYSPPEAGIDFLHTYNANKDKVIIQNVENICRALRHHPMFLNRFRYDRFMNIIETRKDLDWKPLQDTDIIDLQAELQTVFPFFLKVGKEMVSDALMKVAEEHAVDTAIDYVSTLVWDKVPRIDTWLTHTYGVADNVYHRAVASNWMKGLAKRLARPGCKFDYVLVLEGDQGVKKSTSLQILGSITPTRNIYSETVMSTDSKDFFMQFAGKAIIEFSEGETLSRTEVKRMKAIITMQNDRYRLPYGKITIDFPRRCVFAMTTNQEEYLKDETGNRRWLPVRVLFPEANIEWLEANREQLYAEAYHRAVTLNETIYEFPKEETRAAQDARRVSDPNEDRIVDWYYNDQFRTQGSRTEGITCEMVFREALSGFGAMKKYEEMAIADVLRTVLGLQKVRKMINGGRQWRWINPTLITAEELAEAMS